MRVPVVAGVGGGVGTTTVVVGLRGHDGGRARPEVRPDILVCRATLDSVRRAAALLDDVGPEPPPVLAVTLDGRGPRRPLRAQLELLEADTAGLVLLPHVRRWCTVVDPLAEAAQLLVEPVARLPRPLRAYAAALRELVAAVAASGRLGGSPPGRAPRAPDAGPAAFPGSPVRPPVAGAFPPATRPVPRRGGPAGPAAPHREAAFAHRTSTLDARHRPQGVRIVAPAAPPRHGRTAAVPAGRIEQVG